MYSGTENVQQMLNWRAFLLALLALTFVGCSSEGARKQYALEAIEIKHKIEAGQFGDASHDLDRFKVNHAGSAMEKKYKVSGRLRDFLSACADSVETREMIAKTERQHAFSAPNPEMVADKNKILELDGTVVRGSRTFLDQAIEAVSAGKDLPADHEKLAP